MGLFDDFGDLDSYADDLTPPPASPSKPAVSIDVLPDIPTGEVLTAAQIEEREVATRQDKPVAYVPKVKPVLAKPESAPQTTIESRSLPVQQSRQPVLSTEPTGSINKISTPPLTAPISFLKVNVPTQDLELMALADPYDVFSLKQIADYQVVSPTSAEFIAQYYRLVNTMIAKVTLNQLVTKPIEVSNLWIDGITKKTLNTSGNTVFFYDSVYRYCVEDSVINKLRRMYKSKRIHFTQMQTHQIMGAGHGISSAQQAAFYLEKMATASFSSTIGMLIYREKMVKVRDWFERILPISIENRKSIQALIQNAVIKSSEEQAKKYEDDNDVFVVADHRCILFAKKLLNRHSNNQLSDNQLQLTALTFLMSGVSEAKPNLANIGFKNLFSGLENSPQLTESLIQLSYEGHRHCYPINELSHI